MSTKLKTFIQTLNDHKESGTGPSLYASDKVFMLLGAYRGAISSVQELTEREQKLEKELSDLLYETRSLRRALNIYKALAKVRGNLLEKTGDSRVSLAEGGRDG